MTKRPKCVRRSENGRSGTQTAQPEVFNETGNQKKEEKLLFNHSFFSALLKCSTEINPAIVQQPDPSGNVLTLKGFKVTGCTESAIPLLIDNGSGSYVYSLSITPAPHLLDPPKEQVKAGKTVTLPLTGTDLKDATASVALQASGQPNDLQVKSADITPTVDTKPSDKGLTVTLDLSDASYYTANYTKKGAKAVVYVSTKAGGPSNKVTFTLQ